MSAIKDFFKKKKADAKFKLAGGGHKLGEASAAPKPVPAAARPRPEARQHPSTSAQQAGAAALNRIAEQTKAGVGGYRFFQIIDFFSIYEI